jgi:hypothetical protein
MLLGSGIGPVRNKRNGPGTKGGLCRHARELSAAHNPLGAVQINPPGTSFRPASPNDHVTTLRPRYATNGSKSRSQCRRSYPLSIQRVAIIVSTVSRMVTPRRRLRAVS